MRGSRLRTLALRLALLVALVGSLRPAALRAEDQPSAIERIRTQLESQELGVRRKGVLALMLLQHPERDKMLLALLSDADWRIRAMVVRGALRFSDPKARYKLIEMLADKDPRVRADAARVMGSLREHRAVEALIGLLRDSSLQVRRAAVDALIALRAPRAAEALLRVLGTRDPSFRVHVIRALGYLKVDRAAPQLMGFLKAPDAATRKEAIEALMRIGVTASQLPALIARLGDPSHAVRDAAVHVCRLTKDARCVAPLAKLLSDPQAYLQRKAAQTLGILGQLSAVPHLLRALDPRDASLFDGIVASLKKLTGKDFGSNRDAWIQWWNAEQKRKP